MSLYILKCVRFGSACRGVSKCILLLSVLFLCASCYNRQGAESESLETELHKLDGMVRDADKYDKLKEASIDSVKRRLHSLRADDYRARWECYETLGEQFHSYSSDSAVVYFDKAIAAARMCESDSLLTLSGIGRINALSAAGIFASAQHELALMMPDSLSYYLDIERAKAGRQLYSYMTSFVEGHEVLSPEVKDRLDFYTDYLLKNMEPNDPYRLLLEYEGQIASGKYERAKPGLESMVSSLPQKSNLYGRAAYQLALAYRHSGDEEGYARMLALASESDILGSVKEGMALPALSQWLFKKGQTQRAYDYINLSMTDAKSGNARMRTGMIAGAVSVIDNAYQQSIKESRTWITFSLVLAVVLLVVSFVLLVITFKQKKKTEDARQKLREFTRVQDSYIGHFIGLCASYSDKLNSMSKLVSRKISSGQSEDLLKMVKSGKFADEQSEDFFSHFDKVFLDLYPNFVEEINTLLRDDSKIILKSGGTLSPELRIYAFVRLGVDESVKISKILHYSPATIYTYRNKMRNRALNRDTFDDDVMTVCSHS